MIVCGGLQQNRPVEHIGQLVGSLSTAFESGPRRELDGRSMALSSTTINPLSMATTLNPKELTLVYNSSTSEGKKALAFAYSLAPKVNKQDVNEVSLSSTFVRQVVKQLNLRPKDLMNRAHPYYQEHVRGRDLDMEGWLHVLTRNPHLWRAPVALLGDKAVLCEPASLIYTLNEAQRAAVMV